MPDIPRLRISLDTTWLPFYIFTWLSDKEIQMAYAVLSQKGSHHGTADILKRLTETNLMRNSLQRCG